MTRLTRPRTTLLLFTLISTITFVPAFADGNLLDNPGFDDDLSGWDNPRARMGEWSELDASSSPLSGSVLILNEFAPNNGATPTV